MKKLVKKVMAKLRNLDQYIPLILKVDSNQIPELLKTIQKDHRLDNESLGDFIQNIIGKHKVVSKRPELKNIILNFVKENRILGIHF